MRTFMDEFDVVPGRTGGAEIVMSKKIPDAGKPSGNGNHGNSSSDTAPRPGSVGTNMPALFMTLREVWPHHHRGFEREDFSGRR